MQHSWKAKGKSNSSLIDQLKSYNILKSSRVEAAMRAVDRGNYSKSKSAAYQDTPHSIGYKATISAPHMHTHALETLEKHLIPGARILDVGSGSGYLTAVMATMVENAKDEEKNGIVIGIDIIPELVKWATENVTKDNKALLDKGLLEFKQFDGWEDLKDEFDAIHVGAAAETIPDALVTALKPGGSMYIPVGTYSQQMVLLKKDSNGTVTKETQFGVRYVPLVKTKKSKKSKKTEKTEKTEKKTEDGL